MQQGVGRVQAAARNGNYTGSYRDGIGFYRVIQGVHRVLPRLYRITVGFEILYNHKNGESTMEMMWSLGSCRRPFFCGSYSQDFSK